MADEELDVLGGDALGEEVGDDHSPERVGRDDLRKPGAFQAALENGPDGPGLERAGLEGVPSQRQGPEEGGLFRVAADAGGRQVGGEPFVQVVADGDFAFPAALLAKPEGPEVAVIAEILEPQRGDGAYTGARVGHSAEQRAVSKSGEAAGVERGEKLAGLVGGDLGRLAVAAGPAGTAHGLKGVEQDDMSGDQDIEESPECGERQPLARGGGGELVDETGGGPRSDPGELDVRVVVVAPGKEAMDPAGVRKPGVRVADPGGKELVGCEARHRARPAEDGGENETGVGRNGNGELAHGKLLSREIGGTIRGGKMFSSSTRTRTVLVAIVCIGVQGGCAFNKGEPASFALYTGCEPFPVHGAFSWDSMRYPLRDSASAEILEQVKQRLVEAGIFRSGAVGDTDTGLRYLMRLRAGDDGTRLVVWFQKGFEDPLTGSREAVVTWSQSVGPIVWYFPRDFGDLSPAMFNALKNRIVRETVSVVEEFIREFVDANEEACARRWNRVSAKAQLRKWEPNGIGPRNALEVERADGA